MESTTEERDHIDGFLEAIHLVLPNLDLEVEGIVDRIGGLSRRLHRTLDETLAEFGLESGEPFCSTPGRLGKHMELSSGAMTNRIDRLEQAGLVRRRPDPNDRRGVLVEMTEKGRETYERAVGVQAKKEELVTSALDNAEKKQLNDLLRRLMLEFERREQAGPTAKAS